MYADKVLHGSTNHLFLIRANEQGKAIAEAALKTVIVPLDGSPLAEKVLPYVVDLAKKIRLEVILIRAYALPPALTTDEYGTYTGRAARANRGRGVGFLAEKIREIKGNGLENVSSVSEHWLWCRRNYYPCAQNTG